MKILIVDDEQIMRNGLRDTVEWEQYGFEIIDAVSNGKKALEACENIAVPDIVITDIRMPVMDGLELTRALLARYPKIQIIILSAYDDFKYAREAIRAGAREYLLKAELDCEDLLALVVKIREQIEMQQQEDRQKQTVSERMEALQENFFIRLLTTMGFETDIRRKLMDLEIRLRPEGLILAHIFGEGICREELGQLGEEMAAGEDGERLKLVNEYCLVSSRSHIILFANAEGWNGQRDNLLRLFQSLKKGTVDSVYFTGPFEGYEQIYRKNEEMMPLLQLYNFYGRKTVCDCDGEREGRPFTCKTMNYATFLVKLVQQIEGNELEQAARVIDEIYCDFLQKLYYPEDIFEMTDMVVRLLEEKAAKVSRTSGKKEPEIGSMPARRQLHRSGTLVEFITEARACSEELINYIESHIYKYDAIINKALKFMYEHMEEKITLQRVAQEVYCSAPYLSFLFKKNLGENFSDYLMKIRMDKAKMLLVTTQYSVTEIAQQVGISNSSFFSKVFMKMINMTPNQYRKEMHNRPL